MSRLRRARRFFQLPFRKKLLLVWMTLMLVAVRLGLSCLPFEMLRRLTARFARARVGETTITQAEVDETIWALGATGRAFPRAGTCLTQALVGYALFGRKGYSTELKIGARRDDAGKFIAHAWLEKDGRVVLGQIGDKHDGYTPFPPLQGLEPHQ